MLPIMMDVSEVPVMLVGNGERTVRKLAALRNAGAKRVTVFATDPTPELMEVAEGQLEKKLPEAHAFAAYRLAIIVDMPDETAQQLAEWARAEQVLVNVEDKKPWCDFFFPSVVRRGDLVLAISTSGKTPSLAKAIRQKLEQWFDEKWGNRVEELAHKREEWQKEGQSMEVIAKKSNQWIRTHYWLDNN